MRIEFILASQSPRRRELLQHLGLPFHVHIANADEDSVTHPEPAVNVVQTARLKAGIVANLLKNKPLNPGTLVLAADTTVALGQEMLNKPLNETAAFDMLSKLRNTKHQVHTGYVLLDLNTGREWQGVSTAVVTMRNYSNEEIEAYIASGDPFDKAGAYAIQHAAFRPVANLDGCYCNVMGLPICDLIISINQFMGLRFNDIASRGLTGIAQIHQNYPCVTLKKLQQSEMNH